MSTAAKASPKATELFVASLVATALVYGAGIGVIAILVGLTSLPSGAAESLKDAVTFVGFFMTIGAFFAAFAAFLIVAPLGTALGKLMLRFTSPAWWQGPATGALVAVILVALALLILQLTGEPADPGTYAAALVPIVLAPFAGDFVQRRILRWPER